MNTNQQSFFPVRVAALEVLDINVESASESTSAETSDPASQRVSVCITIKSPKVSDEGTSNPNSSGQATQYLQASAPTMQDAVTQAIQPLCQGSLVISHHDSSTSSDGQTCCLVTVDNQQALSSRRAGLGRGTGPDQPTAMVLATIRAANHAGLLNRDFRANNQKLLREWAQETAAQIEQLHCEQADPEINRLLTESILLESFNKVASAAVITATNHPRPETILSLFDTSVWLFDTDGQRRDSYTDTNLWLAWYPGVNNDSLLVDDVIKSMPASPDTAIPWIVRLFENPKGRLRFRGAIELEDHDILHVLLGRGLQDQDEAFVLGFAMGTAKNVSRLETAIFKFILTRLYPEPYKIPDFLAPAFDLGVKCGRQTGNKNLYKQDLKDLRSLTLADARHHAGIDMNVVKAFYQSEQELIPYTIASLRLP